MILVDTSVWINHFRKHSKHLTKLLFDNLVCTHEYIIGELACGNLNNRKEILTLLTELRILENSSLEEILFFIERNNIIAKDIGWIDVNLLATTMINNCKLWTLDKKLLHIAIQMKVGYKPNDMKMN